MVTWAIFRRFECWAAAGTPVRFIPISKTRAMSDGCFGVGLCTLKSTLTERPDQGGSIPLIKHAMGNAVALATVLPAGLFFGFAEVADFALKFDEAFVTLAR